MHDVDGCDVNDYDVRNNLDPSNIFNILPALNV